VVVGEGARKSARALGRCIVTPLTLPALVCVLVDLALEGEPVLLRCVAPPRPEELLAFLLLRRAWPWGLVVCHLERQTLAN